VKNRLDRKTKKHDPLMRAMFPNLDTTSRRLHRFPNAGKAFTAVDRAVGFGLEGHPRITTAGCTYGGVILTRTARGVLASITTGFATLRLVLEAPLSIEFLLAR
jgi:hypothetical protein